MRRYEASELFPYPSARPRGNRDPARLVAEQLCRQHGSFATGAGEGAEGDANSRGACCDEEGAHLRLHWFGSVELASLWLILGQANLSVNRNS